MVSRQLRAVYCMVVVYEIERRLVTMMIALEIPADRTRARALQSAAASSQWRMLDVIVLLYNDECLRDQRAEVAPKSIVHAEIDEWLAFRHG